MVTKAGVFRRLDHVNSTVTLREKAEKALWFAETYGLTLKTLHMEDTTGRQINVNLGQAIHSAISTSSSEGGEVDQSKPSYEMLLESCSKSLDSEWEIKRTPGQAHGAELLLKILLENELWQILKTKEGPLERLKVKISGDGTKISNTSKLFVCSFALVEHGQNFLLSSGNHTIAVVKGKEDHDTLRESSANVIQDVNKLVKDGEIDVDGQTVKLEFFLGGDYKFLLIAMGMKAATSNYSCIWCKIHKTERCNMSHSCEHFASAAMARTIVKSWSKQPGCHSDPFFQIPIDIVVLDELHLMLTITDKLEQGLILDIRL